MKIIDRKTTMTKAGKDRSVFGAILAAAVLPAAILLCVSCTKSLRQSATLSIRLSSGIMETKSGVTDPDEYLVSDVNIYVYNCQNLLEKHLWVKFPSEGSAAGDGSIEVDAIAGESYSVYAFCNAGYSTPDLSGTELENYTYYMSRPDAYSQGIPMAGSMKGVIAGEASTVTIELERLMSKISLRVDRSGLDEDIDFYVNMVKIGNCPRCARPFNPTPVQSHSGTFASGFSKCDGECSDLNTESAPGLSGEVAVYALENPSGKLDKDCCPYVELYIDYLSDSLRSADGASLIYRFYIREKDSYMFERNCHYKVTVTPRRDGLMDEDSWRVDKSALVPVQSEYYMKISPEGSWSNGTFYPYYYEMETNSSLHFTISTFPKSMEVRLREDLVEDEMQDGRAEWVMDNDGKGFTVNSLGRKCLSTMEVIPGSPLSSDDAETIVVEISDVVRSDNVCAEQDGEPFSPD